MLIHSGKSKTTWKPLQHKPHATQFQDSTLRQGTGNIDQIKQKSELKGSYKHNLTRIGYQRLLKTLVRTMFLSSGRTQRHFGVPSSMVLTYMCLAFENNNTQVLIYPLFLKPKYSQHDIRSENSLFQQIYMEDLRHRSKTSSRKLGQRIGNLRSDFKE